MLRLFLCSLLWLAAVPTVLQAQQPLYRSGAFTVTDTSVHQQDYYAVAASATRLRSNFVYEAARKPKRLLFKFALNAEDNEAAPGKDHSLFLTPEGGRLVTPVYTFGVMEPAEAPPVLDAPVQGAFDVTFSVDLRAVLRAFEEAGHYDPPKGAPIAAADFEGVYLAGSESPLSWDFNALRRNERFRLTDPDGDGVFELTLRFEQGGARPFDDAGFAVWSLQEDVSGLPRYGSGQPLVDALYTLSLEELVQDVRADGAFMAGAKWPGVWTRDVSYSIVLALALVDPDGARRSLRAKVQDGRIIQDTGTGGSWPVSSDRMTWALAAWEVYLTTGDDGWLREAFDVIRRSAEADLQTVRDPATGLFFGESSFLDWREQTYPRWMDPKDIYLSQCLGTNVVHFATYRILAQMAELLGEPADAYARVAAEVKDAINTYLWQADLGYYAQFRYGRDYASLSPRAEALGAALAVLTGVASPVQRTVLLRSLPMTPFGVPSIYPQITGIPPYHNDGIWPFVVAFWTWAGAHGGNSAVVERGLASIYRAAALFLTNKENLVASTGHFEGTQINSDRQLWSVAGTLATVYRVFLGMRFFPDRLEFHPFVPAAYAGSRTLTNLRYRDAVLTVSVEGFGHSVAGVTLDGEPVDAAVVPGDLEGAHTLVVTLADTMPPGSARRTEIRFTPETPRVLLDGQTLRWDAVTGAAHYDVYRNGSLLLTTPRTQLGVEQGETLSAFQVRAVDGRGLASFLSEPVRVVQATSVMTVQPAGPLVQEHTGFTGGGYLPLTTIDNRRVRMTVEVPVAGVYGIEARYANGSGPLNTDNKAAIRSLSMDGDRQGPLVMPQRGAGLWNDWGYSNPLAVPLEAGPHTLELAFTPSDENMNRDVNTALLDHLRLTLLQREE